MSKRAATTEFEDKIAKKKSKLETKKTKWRAQFMKYSNPRIKLAVTDSLHKKLPIILIKDSPTSMATYHMFWPSNQEIGERVLNLLECQYGYGHVEDIDDVNTKDYLASQDHIYIVEALCRSELDTSESDLINLYFHMTVDEIGQVKEVDSFNKLSPLLYIQPCYGYF